MYHRRTVPSIDDLITKFEADDRGYIAGTARMVSATVAFGDKVGEVTKTIAEKFKFTELIAPLAALGTAAGLVEMGKKAVDTAMQFDLLNRKLIGITQSAAKAKEIMAFGESEANKTGLFDAESLDRASIKLEGFGLNAQKYLPMLERFASLFGDGAESIDQLAVALGRLEEGGNTGRIMQMLARYGVGVNDLKAAGVQFKDKTPTSSPGVILEAIGSISQQPKYANLQKELEGGPKQKAGIAAHEITAAYNEAGQAILATFLPAFTRVGSLVKELVEGKYFDRLVASALGFFGVDSGNVGDAMDQISKVVKGLPENINAAKKELQPIFDVILGGLKDVKKAWDVLPEFVQKVTAAVIILNIATKSLGIASVGTAFATAGGWIKDFVTVTGGASAAIKVLGQAFVAFLPKIAAVTGALWGLYQILRLVQAVQEDNDAMAKQKAAEDQRIATETKNLPQSMWESLYRSSHPNATSKEVADAYRQSAGGKGEQSAWNKAHGIAGDSAKGSPDSLAQAQLDAMRGTRDNTQEMKERLKDLTKHAFGGGDLRREGADITQVEISAGRKSGFRGIPGTSAHVASAIADAIADQATAIANKVIAAHMRQGYSG